MVSLDLDFVRAQFPVFSHSESANWAHLENAGGSYVPDQVISLLQDFFITSKVQPYWDFGPSAKAGEAMDRSLELIPSTFNADRDEVHFGPSTSQNTYVLAQALRPSWNIDDEIIVTNQDHEANIGAWRRLASYGFKIKEWKLNPKNAELEIDDLKKLLNKKTKIVAVTHCSNIVGSINNLKLIAEIVHEYNAYIVGDGVSYAPHGFPDVKELDVDFYAFSLYKTYGPHLGLLYGKKEILKSLENQNHEFLEGDVPYTLNPGGPNHEELSSLIGIYEYFDNLYNHHFSNVNVNIRKKIMKINELIANHEEKIANPLLEFISSNKNINLIGKTRIINRNRAPTIACTFNNKSSKTVAKELVNQGIATRNDNFYAWRCLKALGIDTEDGVVRMSLVHYNSNEDVNKLIDALKNI